MASPIDLDISKLIGWAFSGIGAILITIGTWIYKRLRKLNRIETEQIIEQGLDDFEAKRIMPIIHKLEGRLNNVEKLERSLGAIHSDIAHLKNSVEKNAEDASNQLTGAMKRISDQRQEDREIQLERIDSLKELIQAKLR